MKPMRKMAAVSMAAFMTAGMLIGCGNSGGSRGSASSQTNANNGSSAATASSEAGTDKDWNVAYLAKNVVDPFAVKMNNEAKKDLDQMVSDGLIKDWQMYDAQTDPALQVSLLEDAVTNGANAVLLQPCEAAGSDPVVTRCSELGIPIIVINALTDSTEDLATGYVLSDDYQAGVMMGNYIKEKLPEGGKYVHMMGVVGNSAQQLRGKGIADTLPEADGYENGGDYAAEWLAEKAVSFATDAVTQYSDELKAIVCDNDDMSSAVQAYCNSVGRSDIVCIGVDGNDGALSMIKSGELAATVFQDGEAQVEYAINTILKSEITGQSDGVEKKKNDIPFVLVTADNIDDYYKK